MKTTTQAVYPQERFLYLPPTRSEESPEVMMIPAGVQSVITQTDASGRAIQPVSPPVSFLTLVVQTLSDCLTHDWLHHNSRVPTNRTLVQVVRGNRTRQDFFSAGCAASLVCREAILVLLVMLREHQVVAQARRVLILSRVKCREISPWCKLFFSSLLSC